MGSSAGLTFQALFRARKIYAYRYAATNKKRLLELKVQSPGRVTKAVTPNKSLQYSGVNLPERPSSGVNRGAAF